MSCRECVCLECTPHLRCTLGGGSICAEDLDSDDAWLGGAVCAFDGPFVDRRAAEAARDGVVRRRESLLGEYTSSNDRVDWAQSYGDSDVPIAEEVLRQAEEGMSGPDLLAWLRDRYDLNLSLRQLYYGAKRGNELRRARALEALPL